MNVTVYVLRYAFHRENLGRKFITNEERINAIEFWVKYEQSIEYKKEIKSIKAGDKLPPKSSIASLRPFLDEKGIIRVGTNR